MQIMGIPRKWWALVGISTCSFIAFIDFTIVNTALPAIQHDLGLSVLQLQWVMNGFLLFYCLLLATMGRISDMYGHRRWLYIGVMVFTLASLAAALAKTPQY
jgi:MFS family permease